MRASFISAVIRNYRLSKFYILFIMPIYSVITRYLSYILLKPVMYLYAII